MDSLVYEFNIGKEHSMTIVQKPKGITTSMLHSELCGMLRNTKRDHTQYHERIYPYSVSPLFGVKRNKRYIDRSKSLESAFEHLKTLREQFEEGSRERKVYRKHITTEEIKAQSIKARKDRLRKLQKL